MSEFAAPNTTTGADADAHSDAHFEPDRSAATSIAHESYSFACMRCGHGWEQSYEIEHHVDGDGVEFVIYVANGHRVPSPLSRPTCANCGSHVVRIMRPGRVSTTLRALENHHHAKRHNASTSAPASREVPGQDSGEDHPERHHWHLSDLLHLFGHHESGQPARSGRPGRAGKTD
ncbi:hypothetical protein [Streptomyces beihaiensis]|uniref:C2H2-type domain-containing protein n=1 Tax=Streptomyces beihaiensis TaxID=2984495 RepID=A0ABT3TUB9_9ACTN|nr:hypothetical protein [Streptomyces beihaiensis]MCX3060626.1 hypothetical protein [Streptomyces beihaiensis]